MTSFTSFPNALWGKLSPNETVVYLALRSYYPNIFPSYEQIAERSGLSRATVHRTLLSLRGKGVINWITKPHRGGWVNLYSLNDQIPEEGGSATATLPSPIHEEGVVSQRDGGSSHAETGGRLTVRREQEQENKTKGTRTNLKPRASGAVSDSQEESDMVSRWRDDDFPDDDFPKGVTLEDDGTAEVVVPTQRPSRHEQYTQRSCLAYWDERVRKAGHREGSNMALVGRIVKDLRNDGLDYESIHALMKMFFVKHDANIRTAERPELLFRGLLPSLRKALRQRVAQTGRTQSDAWAEIRMWEERRKKEREARLARKAQQQ